MRFLFQSRHCQGIGIATDIEMMPVGSNPRSVATSRRKLSSSSFADIGRTIERAGPATM